MLNTEGLVEKPLRNRNEISKAESGRPQNMMMKHKHEFEQICSNVVMIRAEKEVMHFSMCEAPSTSVFHQVWGSIPKRKNQPTPFTNAIADDHVPEFHHKLLQETAQQSCTKQNKLSFEISLVPEECLYCSC